MSDLINYTIPAHVRFYGSSYQHFDNTICILINNYIEMFNVETFEKTHEIFMDGFNSDKCYFNEATKTFLSFNEKIYTSFTKDTSVANDKLVLYDQDFKAISDIHTVCEEWLTEFKTSEDGKLILVIENEDLYVYHKQLIFKKEIKLFEDFDSFEEELKFYRRHCLGDDDRNEVKYERDEFSDDDHDDNEIDDEITKDENDVKNLVEFDNDNKKR